MTPTPRRPPLVLRASSFVLLALLLVSCGAPVAASGGKAPWPGPFATPDLTPTAVPALSLPRDEAPHDALTEWWYYTGHFTTADGASYGFETVIFQSSRADYPKLYAAHVAITDHARGAFHYDQRSGNARVGAGPGFDFTLGDWSWRGSDGHDHVAASVAGYAFQLDLTAVKPPALHDGGYVDFGPGGGSYYYSRTRMDLRGTLDDHGTTQAVTGEAWFDHQWGNFLGSGAGGWDWFSAQLADGSDVMLVLLRDRQHAVVASYGTFVAPDGRTIHIAGRDIAVDVLDHWTSPHTGITYPSGWRVTLRDQDLTLTFTPVLKDQELDTRASTGNIYWEGEETIVGTRAGQAITGKGYVELTGYDEP